MLFRSEEAANDIENGNEVSINFDTGVITNITKNKTYQAQAFPEFIKKIMEADGLVQQTKKRLSN